ncbi:hypothetical protein F441_15943 [Phytophthora nicotianae CJ01A1]|uniref:Uncharacterized protein n=5 Tax=Phytophthora nicotianae TaxID=4792 RepID=V9EG10_PHYNI|nr:hypothetical protein F443_16114 [Phytophthora nicotianae P1569]ETK78270.1 hypothetical protein L915_15660 [Phytophthora nicotianae]ETO66886.1 hypothetical protein F444_16100 [Phytophthora nicotianae P1976]ETP07998.1 hypothetical protein F441_15943 [Phytophthora nicotianae CJ01A1]ETP35982.1 hypothetical protein F442_15967 [Phytophthora nicotianae P10297]
MVSHHSTTSLLQRAAHDINEQLEHEDFSTPAVNDETTRALVLATATGDNGVTSKTTRKRQRSATNDENDKSFTLVELRRRRNKGGQNVLEHKLRPLISGWTRTTHGGRWSTKDGRAKPAGLIETNTRSCIEAAGSRKTRILRKSCNRVTVAPLRQTADDRQE